jgi:probable DNA metabolism protein
MKTPENFMEYLAAHRDCNEEILDYARMLTNEDIETGTEPKTAKIRKMVSSVRTEIHRMRGFIRLVPLADNISYGFMEPDHDIGKWVATSLAHRFPNTEIILGNTEHTWRAQYTQDGITHTEGPGIMETIEERKKEQGLTAAEPRTDTQKLWMTYYLSQNCQDRRNLKLFQKNMPEKHMESAGLVMEKSVAYLPLESFM